MSGIETVDKYTVRLQFGVGAETFEDGLNYSYNKNKNRFSIQGFRKGKAPRKLIEKQYGRDVFYEDAVNYVLPAAYDKAVKEHSLNVVGKPSIDVESVSQEEGASFAAVAEVVGEASIDEYYALTYKKYDTEPTDGEIQKRVDSDRDKNARIVTVVRPVQAGDIVTIDFEGFIGDTPFEGGKAEGFKLTIGEHAFIGDFEDQLIGAETGENIFVRVKFPDDYNNSEVAGKPAVFDVQIKEVQEKELPEMDDDFAQDVSEFDTFDEYREDIVSKLRESRGRDAQYAKDDQVMSELASKAAVDLPPSMIENRMDDLVNNFESQLQYQMMPLDGYLQYIGQTKEQLRESYRAAAINSLKASLALEAVAKKENLAPSEGELSAEIDRLAALYGWDGKQKSNIDAGLIAKDLAVKKAHDFVMDHALEIA